MLRQTVEEEKNIEKENDSKELQKHQKNDMPDWIIKRLLAKTSVLKMAAV